jgi:hypothetical protein
MPNLREAPESVEVPKLEDYIEYTTEAAEFTISKAMLRLSQNVKE